MNFLTFWMRTCATLHQNYICTNTICFVFFFSWKTSNIDKWYLSFSKIFPLQFLDRFDERVPVYLKIRYSYCLRTIETMKRIGIHISDTFFLETCTLVDQASQKVFPLKFLDQFEKRVQVYHKISNFHCFRTIETIKTIRNFY